MVTVLALLGVVTALFAAAVVATRSDPALAPAPPDRPDLVLPDRPLEPADVVAVRFSTAVRGYRMDEVDRVLERLAEELAERDRQIAELIAGASPQRRSPEPGGREPGGPGRWTPE
ncbi:MAG TPA: DivIVA domain-containing protein [Mycobacteriales bacterium]|nr:DivIVA domain-containing protein [Mycobacteriales bacterium]